MKAYRLDKGQFSPEQWKDFGNQMDEMGKNGTMWEVVIRKPVRTGKQNRMIHAVFTEISDALEMSGLEIMLEMPPSAGALKEFFKSKYLDGKTSKASTKKLAEAFDRFLRHFNISFATNGMPPIEIQNEDYKSLTASQPK